MQQKIYLEWENVNFLWENVNLLWEEVYILIVIGEARKRGGGGSRGLSEMLKDNPWDQSKTILGEEKAKKFIKLICRINDLDYEKTIEKKEDIKLEAHQIEKVVIEAAKIGVNLS